MAIFNEQYTNILMSESSDMIGNAVSNKIDSFTLYGKDIDIIKKETNRICKEVYKKSKNKYAEKDMITKCPKFGNIEKYDGYLFIMLSGISDRAYGNGYGLDFQRDVARELDKVESLKRYSFETEDYPGIMINCHSKD